MRNELWFQETISSFGRVAMLGLLALLMGAAASAQEAVTASRAGDELVVRLERFDLLRQTHPGLQAVVQLRGMGKQKVLAIDLSEAAVQGSLVFDLTRFGKCTGIVVAVSEESGKVILAKTISPVPELVVRSQWSSAKADGQTFAYIEAGTAMRGANGTAPRTPTATDPTTSAPRILLPQARQLRRVKLEQPERRVAKQEITYPVVADLDLPLVGGSVLGRQTAAPNDPQRASLYFPYKKGIYDGPTLSRWQKFLVEVPIQNAWGEGEGDESLELTPDQFEVHITNENAPSGRNMLGSGDGDLGQKGEMDSDDQGRIYWRVEGGGAYVVRFNPQTKKFEQPPVRLDFQKFVPTGLGMLNDNLCKVTCTRGRVFFTMCNDTLGTGDPGNAHRRRLGGVFSIPQDWSDAAAFEQDIRLHVGSWETAPLAFYKAPPKADADVRKLGGCGVTETGLFITTAGPKYEGGPWRLDLDDRGQTKFFGQVASLDATIAADGTRLTPTKLVEVKGTQKGKELNPGPGAGRGLISYSSGEITIPRASVRLLVHGTAGLNLQRASKHAFPTYAGAPKGMLTVSYDLIEKLKSAPAARGALADSLSGGASLGPAFLVTPIPGEVDRALAVCEYTGYPVSVLDFSHVATRKTVSKSFLPTSSLTPVGLGPYNSQWVSDAGALWLYVGGYTGMARIKYSQAGRPVGAAIRSDVFNGRLAPRGIDGSRRTSMKKIDGLISIFGGRLLDSGYGIGDRGGDALSTGVELFEPRSLDATDSKPAPSQTASYLSRCFALKTLQSRLVWNAEDGTRRQEVFAASGSVRKELINELSDQDKSLAPGNLDAKIFCYEVTEREGLRDLFGFSLPPSENDHSVEGHIALSPCRRFLVVLTQRGLLYTYSIAQQQFIDGLTLSTPTEGLVPLMEFHRPSEIIFTSPNGQIFFLAAPYDPTANSASFHEILVDDTGRLSIRPYLAITLDAKDGHKDLERVVRCFLPDLKQRDGSYDFVLGYSQSTVAPFVRVIKDFIRRD